MKKLVFALCFVSVSVCAQSSRLSMLQGAWRYLSVDTADHSFKLFAGKKCLDFSYTFDSHECTLLEMIVGFQDSAHGFGHGDEIYVDSLKSDGLFYTEIIDKKYIEEDGLIKRPNFLTPFYFSVDEEVLSINGGKLFEYEKISQLPYKAVSCLFYAGKRDKHDYLKEYLSLTVRSVKPSRLYAEPNQPSNFHLKENDIVILIEEGDGWLKVKHDENKTGWIKKEVIKDL